MTEQHKLINVVWEVLEGLCPAVRQQTDEPSHSYSTRNVEGHTGQWESRLNTGCVRELGFNFPRCLIVRWHHWGDSRRYFTRGGKKNSSCSGHPLMCSSSQHQRFDGHTGEEGAWQESAFAAVLTGWLFSINRHGSKPDTPKEQHIPDLSHTHTLHRFDDFTSSSLGTDVLTWLIMNPEACFLYGSGTDGGNGFLIYKHTKHSLGSQTAQKPAETNCKTLK